jgi:hypothetical protein
LPPCACSTSSRLRPARPPTAQPSTPSRSSTRAQLISAAQPRTRPASSLPAPAQHRPAPARPNARAHQVPPPPLSCAQSSRIHEICGGRRG